MLIRLGLVLLTGGHLFKLLKRFKTKKKSKLERLLKDFDKLSKKYPEAVWGLFLDREKANGLKQWFEDNPDKEQVFVDLEITVPDEYNK